MILLIMICNKVFLNFPIFTIHRGVLISTYSIGSSYNKAYEFFEYFRPSIDPRKHFNDFYVKYNKNVLVILDIIFAKYIRYF